MIRVAPDPQRLIVGSFLVLAAMVCAVAPMPPLFRSAGVVLFAYLSFGMGGMPFAYLSALLAPPVGLIGGDAEWLVMLPIVMSGNLLGMLALEFAWRYPALVVSPLLLVTPAIFVQVVTRRELFAISLPWDDARGTWITLHLLVAALGILTAFVLDRRRARMEERQGALRGGPRAAPRPGRAPAPLPAPGKGPASGGGQGPSPSPRGRRT